MKSIIITTIALALGTVSASAFPTDWAAQGKTCADAGLREDGKPVWCPMLIRKGCVPCPRERKL